MTQEEKAKRYDESLERARDYYKANLKLDNVDENLVLEDIFPELKESEDEKIIKEMKDFFSLIMLGQENFRREDYDWNAWIACLESFKDRVQQQPKQEWSEEDKEMIGNIRSAIQKYAFSHSAVDVNGDLCEKEYIEMDEWLKAL